MAALTEQRLSQDSTPAIPEKRYFKIGEVCKIVGIKQHVVRYWETEFKQFIKPQRASSKQRLYRRVDIENLLRIKQLLKTDGFTIPGARKFLADEQKTDLDSELPVVSESLVSPEAVGPDSPQLLTEIKDGLQSVLRLLEGKG